MYSTEEAIKRTLHDIEEMEAVNKILPEVKKVIAKFDGKVMNKRLDDVLKAANFPGRIYIDSNYRELWDIQYHPEGSNSWYTILCGAKPSNQYYDPDKSFVNPDKRISAERAFRLIEQRRVERLQKITAYKDHLNTWEEKKNRMDILKKELRIIADSIPYTMQDYFNMRVKYY